MKSSTVGRATLSKESMEVIEHLAKDQQLEENSVGEYYRPEDVENEHKCECHCDCESKDKEIDLLWQNFKSPQLASNSPMIHISIGFVIGVLSTLFVLACFGVFSNHKDVVEPSTKSTLFGVENIFNKEDSSKTLEEQAEEAQNEMENRVSIPSEDDNSLPVASSEESASDNVQPIDMSKVKKYIVKDGDTGEAIIKHNYGSWSQERVDRVMKANNLKNFDRLQIGQELLLPLE